MKLFKIKNALLLIAFLFTFQIVSAQEEISWQDQLEEQLQLHGHRNWILVVDAAYPYQAKQAIKTINTGDSQLKVVKHVLKAVNRAPHIFPEIFLDKEIDFISDMQAEGMNDYKEDLFKLLDGQSVSKKLHEDLIAQIDEAAKVFNILVLKTDLTIPYTSVFFRLDCGYWNGEQEKEMRNRMK